MSRPIRARFDPWTSWRPRQGSNLRRTVWEADRRAARTLQVARVGILRGKALGKACSCWSSEKLPKKPPLVSGGRLWKGRYLDRSQEFVPKTWEIGARTSAERSACPLRPPAGKRGRRVTPPTRGGRAPAPTEARGREHRGRQRAAGPAPPDGVRATGASRHRQRCSPRGLQRAGCAPRAEARGGLPSPGAPREKAAGGIPELQS